MQEKLLFDTGAGNVEVIAEPSGLCVVATGEIDYEARSRLDEVYHAVAEQPPCDVVVDLGRTTFLDSVGLGFVVRLHKQVSLRGHQLTVVASPQQVRRMFGLTGLDRVLTIATQPPSRF
jgi:anti-sigma B factor antagonist